MAETSSLLNCRTGNGIGGSNPPLSAKPKINRLRAVFLFASSAEARFRRNKENKKKRERSERLIFGL